MLRLFWLLFASIDTWVFDDASKGLDKEPFVQGIPEMIDLPVADIPSARAGFILLFSSEPFAGQQIELTPLREEYGRNWHKPKDQDAEGWLRPTLLKYFDSPPAHLYIKAEPGRGRYSQQKQKLSRTGQSSRSRWWANSLWKMNL